MVRVLIWLLLINAQYQNERAYETDNKMKCWTLTDIQINGQSDLKVEIMIRYLEMEKHWFTNFTITYYNLGICDNNNLSHGPIFTLYFRFSKYFSCNSSSKKPCEKILMTLDTFSIRVKKRTLISMTFAFTLVFTQDLTVQLIDECGSLQTVMNVR